MAPGDPTARPLCRAVVTDVDGTLFPFGTNPQLSEANAAALQRALDSGVPVSLATGRIPGRWSEELWARLPGLGPGVFANGALVLGPSGEVLHEEVLPADAVKIVERLFRQGTWAGDGRGRISLLAATTCPDGNEERSQVVYFELAPLGATWVTALIDSAAENPVVLKEDFECIVGRKIFKFVLFTRPEDEDWASMAPVVAALREQLAGSGVTVLDCGERQCEILPPGVNKGTGVQALLRLSGDLPADALLACGDAENDVEMLRLAGVGAAMGNAKAAAREAADVVVATNEEDGVAEAVRRYVFGEIV